MFVYWCGLQHARVKLCFVTTGPTGSGQVPLGGVKAVFVVVLSYGSSRVVSIRSQGSGQSQQDVLYFQSGADRSGVDVSSAPA